MANFNFLGKGLGIVLDNILYMIFQKKNYLILYSTNWPNFIVWLPLLLKILGKMCIAIVCFQGCDIINFEVNPLFLIKPFLCVTKTSRQKFKYLKNGKRF